MACSSSPSLPPSTYGHHVYISFRRDQESRNVTDSIDRGLEIRGVHTYRDRDHLATSQTGIAIPRELREGMQDSTISVVMLSKGYLASSWCLEELVKILDCRERNGMVVLPIFYGVDPSDIRKARGYAAQQLRSYLAKSIPEEPSWPTLISCLATYRPNLIEFLHTNAYVKYLEHCLIRERQKKAIQAQRLISAPQ
ncbi:hypothetical protein RJ639_015733 [Escallonia herrerae]|uniref:ADP-ribosyl cyclase/cyclic ADP-ribose hydrolase n=1 Tax=Escallonia herrerae TaxID=1293975 RepID=A0AA88VBU9_9ASTE|nr:hypothetical protein RJ639_015733 [Escallonia herrerae]